MSRKKTRVQRLKKKRRQFLTASSFILIATSLIILFSANTILSINQSKTLVAAENTDEDKNEKENLPSEKITLDGYLFLGDSFTVLLQDTITKHNPTAVVMGQVGVQPSYWNDNFSVLPDNDEVNGVVLLIGVNGATFDDNLPNKEKLIDSLVEKYKGKTIYVEKVFPVGKEFTSANPVTFNEAIKHNNEETETYCDKYDNVIFIDTTKNLVTEDGYLKYTNDGLHITSEKQETFYNNIIDAVNNIK